MILMSLGGPLAEDRLCGPKGVLIGALDDVWQLKVRKRTDLQKDIQNF